MGLFSFLRKNKQEASKSDSEFYSRAEEDSGTPRSRRKRKQGKPAETDDPVLPEKKRARRRLVGAIALVLAAVIGLPMLLDSEPKPVADDIAIQIPSKDKPLSQPSTPAPSASRVAASDSLGKKEQMVEIPPPVAAASQAEQAVAAGAGAQPNPKSAEPPKPAVSEKPASAKSEAKPELKAPSKPETKVETVRKPEAGKPAAKSDDARAVALLEGKSETKPATDKKTEKVVLQVGAFATTEKVNEVRSKLKKAGFQSFTQKVATESGERTRIRVGPFSSKEEADKARAKLAKLGFDGKPVSAEH